MLEFPVEVTETGRQALRFAHRFAASGLDRPAGPSRMGFHVQCKSLRRSGQDSIRHCPMGHIQTFTIKRTANLPDHATAPGRRLTWAAAHDQELLPSDEWNRHPGFD